MTSPNRNQLIDEIVEFAPFGLKLAERTRANLQALSEEELRKLRARAVRLSQIVGKRATPSADLAERRSERAQERAKLYRDMRAINLFRFMRRAVPKAACLPDVACRRPTIAQNFHGIYRISPARMFRA